MILFYGIHETAAGFFGVEVRNYGISFGWGNVNGLTIALLCLAGAVLAAKYKLPGWGWWLLIMGATGNLIDRFRLGYVRDYWRLPVVQVYNNLNDWIIGAGVLILLISLWKEKSK